MPNVMDHGAEIGLPAAMTEETDAEFAAIRGRLGALRYLLVVPVPWVQDPDGRVWLDRLWARDLRRHFDYLTDVTVLAPCRPWTGVPPAGHEPFSPPEGGRLAFRDLPLKGSVLAAVPGFPAFMRAGRAAVVEADVVHSGAAGWPLPAGLAVNHAAWAAGKPLVLVVESAFWRLSGPGPHRLRDRLRAALTESFARRHLARASLAIFTHQGYRDSLWPKGAAGRAIVTPASWLDEADLLDPCGAAAAWEARSARTPRFLLAARLVTEKGIDLLLDTLALAERQGERLEVDVMGMGDLAAGVAAAAERFSTVRLRLLPPEPPGAAFLRALDRYHAVLVPSLSDEQPRILYDAFARALAVIASDNPGHGAVVQGVTGLRFASGRAEALLAGLIAARDDAAGLRRMGLAARDRAEGQTHRAMHLARARALVEVLAGDQSGFFSR